MNNNRTILPHFLRCSGDCASCAAAKEWITAGGFFSLLAHGLQVFTVDSLAPVIAKLLIAHSHVRSARRNARRRRTATDCAVNPRLVWAKGAGYLRTSAPSYNGRSAARMALAAKPIGRDRGSRSSLGAYAPSVLACAAGRDTRSGICRRSLALVETTNMC